jgi:hypothetical protein
MMPQPYMPTVGPNMQMTMPLMGMPQPMMGQSLMHQAPGMGMGMMPSIMQPQPQSKQVNIGPKSTLTEECQIHKGSKILFELCSEDDGSDTPSSGAKAFCERCYQEESKKFKETTKDPKKASEQAPVSDLIKRLKEPAQPFKAHVEEAANKTPSEVVIELHKKIEHLC